MMVLLSMLKGYYAGSGDEYGLKAEEDEQAAEQHRQRVTAPCVKLSMKCGQYFTDAYSHNVRNTKAKDCDTDDANGVMSSNLDISQVADNPAIAVVPLLPIATIMSNCAQTMVRMMYACCGDIFSSLTSLYAMTRSVLLLWTRARYYLHWCGKEFYPRLYSSFTCATSTQE